MLEIIKHPDPRLREVSKEVSTPLSTEDRQLLKEMSAWLKEHKDTAVGLSAIQIGVPKRMCVLRFESNGKLHNMRLVNPRIIAKSPKTVIRHEACLSVEGDGASVKRNEFVMVVGYDAITNTEFRWKATGYEAQIIQHEIDHMDGILYIDRAVN